MQFFTIQSIFDKFKNEIVEYKGNNNISFNSASSLNNIKKGSVIWAKYIDEATYKRILESEASVIITESSLQNIDGIEDKLIISTDKSKHLFIQILKHYFENKPQWGIHPTSVISTKAIIDREVYIGPNCFIGDVIIGAGTIVEGNNFIYDNVQIGKNVIIQAGAVIGSKGMSLSRSIDGKLIDFPSLGNVIIEDNVEIGSNSVIDAAVLDSTIIGEGTKINSSTFIGNSVLLGKDNYVSVSVNINGSVSIGNNNFIGSGSTIRNKINVGNNNTIGAGSVVVKNVGNNETVFGNPATKKNNKGIQL